MIIPPQASYLYYANWSTESDEIVLNTIIKLKQETRWMLPDFPSWFMMTAQWELKLTTGSMFTEAEIKQRMDFMKLWFKTFKGVQMEGGFWDVGAKIIHANDDIWEKILKKTPFAGAYYHRDEPHFAKLACLYGWDDVKKEGETEVVISDQTVKIDVEVEPSCYELPGCYTEVNSPNIFPTRSVRRKLFVDDVETPTNRESSTEIGIYFIENGPNGQLVPRLERGRDLTSKHGADKAGPSTRSPNTSSAASNSPKQWYPHNIRRPPF
ncbi:hypothetical protein SASPL_135099 [Salvia splendens]|uniref:Myb/SANT-like domain-containing protein n=1 Tax=Salvia splendens TaxID=180675 RepID=A0A8X8WVV4_SALSN|nr:uncharacterized protein LOC121761570 [Salvia splendens]KAG6402885.1 hypothetical protein SASPL_135099 [Salvia splendens]